jgi:hypothetical protein
VPDATTIDKNLAKRIAGTVRRLTSSEPNEVNAAGLALVRILQGASKDAIFAVAERIENESNGKLSDDELQVVFDAGVKHGKTLAEKKAQATQQASAQFPSAHAMAMFCYERMGRLDVKHHDFIDKMTRTTRRYTPSPKQQSYLEDLYIQLGGSV